MNVRNGVKYLLELINDSPDEPIFILRGRDKLAPYAILEWARLAENAGVSEEKVCGAIKTCHEMRQYPLTRLPD